MIKTGKILMNGAKDLTLVEEELVLLIHLITKCITFYGCFYEDLLKELLLWANQMRTFPGMVGALASDFFTIVLEELKIPGTAFRKKLRKDFPALDSGQNIFFNKDIYFICGSEDSFSCHEDQSLCTLRKLIIMHILKVSGMSEPEVKEFQECLKHLSN
jgi:hypothetical protein